MRWGKIKLYCSICGSPIILNEPPPVKIWHSHFGYTCSKGCYEEANMKYARMILGKDDE